MEKVDSAEALVSVVKKLGVCYLFKKKDSFRLYDGIRGGDSTARRRQLLLWAEQAHLDRRIFLSVDQNGSLVALSRRKFSESYRERSASELSKDEVSVLRALEHAMPTPELRKASNLPDRRFDRALSGLRYKMRITLVGILSESKTKHINIYDKMKRRSLQMD